MSISERIKNFAKQCYGSTKNLADLLDEKDIYRYTQKKVTPGYNKLLKLYEAGLSLDWLISGNGQMYALNERGMELKKREEKSDPANIKIKYLEMWIKENFSSVTNFAAVIDEEKNKIEDILYKDHSISMDILSKLEWFGCNLNWLSSGTGDEYSDNENGETLRKLSKLKAESKVLPVLIMKRYEKTKNQKIFNN